MITERRVFGGENGIPFPDVIKNSQGYEQLIAIFCQLILDMGDRNSPTASVLIDEDTGGQTCIAISLNHAKELHELAHTLED